MLLTDAQQEKVQRTFELSGKEMELVILLCSGVVDPAPGARPWRVSNGACCAGKG